MTAWVEEFSGDSEEGPFEEDVSALAAYLEQVVKIEPDLEKAVAVVEWVAFMVQNRDMSDEAVRNSWAQVLTRLRGTVQDAVKSRGLQPVEFSGD